jgi:hypothetical protein
MFGSVNGWDTFHVMMFVCNVPSMIVYYML